MRGCCQSLFWKSLAPPPLLGSSEEAVTGVSPAPPGGLEVPALTPPSGRKGCVSAHLSLQHCAVTEADSVLVEQI